ncbi:histone H1.5-like, partial [Lucilia sericata]|uniref:histone H1.5-like n=1 Tax=Lucilia sericata TaxID=13632 RepID=UPI0018A8450A
MSFSKTELNIQLFASTVNIKKRKTAVKPGDKEQEKKASATTSAARKKESAAKPDQANRSAAATKKPVVKKASLTQKVASKAKPKTKNTKKKAAAGKKHKLSSKAKAVALLKPKKAQNNIIKDALSTRIRKVRTNVHFRRPATSKVASNPKYPRKSVPRNRIDAYNMI